MFHDNTCNGKLIYNRFTCDFNSKFMLGWSGLAIKSVDDDIHSRERISYSPKNSIGRKLQSKINYDNFSIMKIAMAQISPKLGDIERGSFVTGLFTLPPAAFFNRLHYAAETQGQTALRVNVLDRVGNSLVRNVPNGSRLRLDQPVRLEFILTTQDPTISPVLDEYSLSFDLTEECQ